MSNFLINVNGTDYAIETEGNRTLLYVLREIIGFTGTKEGCGTSDCGACKVLVDGEAVNSCSFNIKKAEGKKVETIEGLADDFELHPIQKAFVEAGAVQCGYCTPGMIMATKALLNKNNNPSEVEIREALANNLCRCTGYVKILDAVKIAAKNMRGE